MRTVASHASSRSTAAAAGDDVASNASRRDGHSARAQDRHLSVMWSLDQPLESPLPWSCSTRPPAMCSSTCAAGGAPTCGRLFGRCPAGEDGVGERGSGAGNVADDGSDDLSSAANFLGHYALPGSFCALRSPAEAPRRSLREASSMASLRCRTRRSAIRHDVQSLEGALPHDVLTLAHSARATAPDGRSFADIRQTEGVAGIKQSTRGPVLLRMAARTNGTIPDRTVADDSLGVNLSSEPGVS